MGNLLQSASILLTPTAYTASKIESIKPNTSVGDFDFTRATIATRVNSSSFIQSIASGLPRIDFTGSTGHWLIESESTNLDVASAALTTGWTATTGASQGVETGITPFGISGNIKRVSGATNDPPNWVDGVDALKKQYTVTATDPASTFTFSVYVKSAGSSTVNIQIRNNTAGPSNRTGAITLTSDWQRLSATLAVTTTTTKIGIVIAGTDGDILLSGAQLEAQEFATSLIPTDGSTVTRNQDLAINSGDTSLINSTEGVLYGELASFTSSGEPERNISLSNSTLNNTAEIGYSPGTNLARFRVRANNVTILAESLSVSDATQFSKMAIKYKSEDIRVFLDGSQVITDTSSFTFASDLAELALDRGNGNNPFTGKIKSIVVFKNALDNDELEALTGEGFSSFAALAAAGGFTII